MSEFSDRCLTIGSLYFTNARGEMVKITYTEIKALGKKKFVDVCDILTLVDTKYRVESSQEYQPSNQHHTTSETSIDGRNGIMILTRKHIGISEHFTTPVTLRGRGLAIEVSLPTTGPCLEMVIIGVYAPDQGKGAVVYIKFLQDLKNWIATIMYGRRAHSPYYLMGDFNAVLYSYRDSYNQVRAPNIYNQDTSFQGFTRELDLQDPIHLRGQAEGAKFSWTFRTNVRTENELDYTHIRIDYILASSPRGT
jgi:exonuclease III